ncbi:MAG: bifunctional hydroxymethylpyrimidine kinase/phosphomethylpyrimidine kinase, partial [Aestuariivirga sp.]
DTCLGVMTGYFASADQIKVAASFIHKMKDKNPSIYVLVDPVLGDDGSLYVSNEVANAIRDELLPLASCITPNCFELGWLSGKPVSNKSEVLLAAAALLHKEILATSIPLDANNLATLAITGSEYAETSSPVEPSVPHGTGDFLAGLYFAARLNGFESREALKLSSGILDSAISRSLGQPCLDIIGALHNPS